MLKSDFKSTIIHISLILCRVTQTFDSIHEMFSCEAEESGSGLVSVVLLWVSGVCIMNLNIHVNQMSSSDEFNGRWIRWEAAHIHLVTPPLYYSQTWENMNCAFEATFKNWEKLIRDIFEDCFFPLFIVVYFSDGLDSFTAKKKYIYIIYIYIYICLVF